MNRIIALVVLGAIVLGAPIQAGEPLQVMSYNVRYLNSRDGTNGWHFRREAVAKTLQRAHVVGLQECIGSQLADLIVRMPTYYWYGVSREDGEHGIDALGEMTAIGWDDERLGLMSAGTFWLSDQPRKIGSVGWDGQHPRIASWARLADKQTGQQFVLLNTHLDSRGSNARIQSGKLLARWIEESQGGLPVIIVGDFNCQLTDEPMKPLLAGQTPIARDARLISPKKDAGPRGTTNRFIAADSETRIDHILTVGSIAALDFQTLNPKTEAGRFASDHFPVMATFSITD